VYVHRRLATVFVRVDVERGRIGAEDLAAQEAEFDREIGLDQALAQFRAGVDEIKEPSARLRGARRIIAKPRISGGGRARPRIN
jgi:hypothetical protein